MVYNYKSLIEIDKETLDYLDFVVPEPLTSMKIEDINNFLTLLDMNFSDLDTQTEECYITK